MADYGDLLRVLKQMVKETNMASDPADICIGLVTKASPIEIQVDQKFTIDSDNLIIPEKLKDYTLDVTINWETETHSHNHVIHDTYTGGGSSESHTHKHEVKGTKSITIHNALKKGDNVALLKAFGGQKYLIIDRI